MHEDQSHIRFVRRGPAEVAVLRRTSSARPASLAEGVLQGIPLAPTSAREAYEILTTVSARLHAIGDARSVFPDIYAIVTRRVRDSLEGRTEALFWEPAFISRLAGRFCELYLAALRRSLEGEPERIDAWAAADRATAAPGLSPIQHAVLGLNAHINFDLALGLLANVEALGGEEARMERYHHDHDAVNQILREALPEVIALLAERHACPASRLLLRAGRLSRPFYEASLATLTLWRTRVWRDLEDLLAAPDAVERSRIRSRMNLRSSLFARVFSVRCPALAVSRPRVARLC